MRTEDFQIRDPFVYVEKGTYYLYSNHFENGKRTIMAYTGTDLVEWNEPVTVFDPPEDFWGKVDFWAPEMHAYKGNYYLFCSFKAEGRCRATAILKADSPLGPFRPWGAEQITPMDWECLDGTLYVDEAGKPWMVYCHEWVQVDNGEMRAVPLKEDLSGPDGESVLLFRAGDPCWVVSIEKGKGKYVTDGPSLYRAPDGTLNMLWSTFSETGYSVARAKSLTGRVTGPWAHDDAPVYPKDGGHCMLFTDPDGQMRLSLHGPNKSPLERAHFFPVQMEADGKISVK